VSRPELDEIALVDPSEAWEALGFTVGDSGAISLGGVRIRLGATAVGLKLRGLEAGEHDFDGLPITASSAPPPTPASPPAPQEHPIGALAVDHVVALTPDLERTTRKLTAAGLDHRPSRAPQEFFVLGPCLLELGGPAGERPEIWGLTLVVADLERAASQLGDRLGRVKDAVQPGRSIATVRSEEAGIATPLALMTPR
jgi:hypothetical protein